MTVFVSYSHQDSEFVDQIVSDLINENVKIWIDKWEINVGDSIIDKIQNAIENASALLVILSKTSVESPWCKKELNTAIIRELDENNVLVLPVLIEECKIPLFLREKKYADFTKTHDIGMKELLKALAGVSSDSLGRHTENDLIIDWSISHGEDENKRLVLELFIVELKHSDPFSVVTSVTVRANKALTKRYKVYEKYKLDWYYRSIVLGIVTLILHERNFKLHLNEGLPAKGKVAFQDTNSDIGFTIDITSRRLGTDTGNDILLDVVGQLDAITTSLRKTLRSLTTSEQAQLAELVVHQEGS